jgi:LysM repeat protein
MASRQNRTISTVCTFCGSVGDSATPFGIPEEANRCYKFNPAREIALPYQAAVCLTVQHAHCPIFMGSAQNPGDPINLPVPEGEAAPVQEQDVLVSSLDVEPATRPQNRESESPRAMNDRMVDVVLDTGERPVEPPPRFILPTVQLVPLIGVLALLGIVTAFLVVSLLQTARTNRENQERIQSVMITQAVQTAIAKTINGTATAKAPIGVPEIHIVAGGETLEDIARLYYTSVEVLIAVNAITDPEAIAEGERLVVLRGVEDPAAIPEIVTHDVQEGDTLESIAAAYGVDTLALTRVNPGIRGRALLPDETIFIIVSEP